MAILITGGYNARKSSELFLPWNNMTCELPSLPDERYGHVQSGDMMCGGDITGTERSCIMWSAEQEGWVTLPATLTEGRLASSIWTGSRDRSLVILGGRGGAAEETSETVSSDGVSTGPSFDLKYPTG